MVPLFIQSKELRIIQNIPITKTSKFWEGLKVGKICATKCPRCMNLYFPPVVDCPDCLSSGLQWIHLSNEAEILAYTHVKIRPPSFNQIESYIVGIGRLKENVNVLAWLKGFDSSQIKVGTKVKLIVVETENGNFSYQFVPFPGYCKKS